MYERIIMNIQFQILDIIFFKDRIIRNINEYEKGKHVKAINNIPVNSLNLLP